MDWPPVSGNIQYIQCDKDNKTLEVVCSSDQRRFCVLDWTVDFKGSFRPASPGCRCEHSHSSQVQTRTEVVSFRSLIGSGTGSDLYDKAPAARRALHAGMWHLVYF